MYRMAAYSAYVLYSAIQNTTNKATSDPSSISLSYIPEGLSQCIMEISARLCFAKYYSKQITKAAKLFTNI